MAGGVTIGVEGLDKLIKKFGSIPKELERNIDAELGAAAVGFENRAVNDAPTDRGMLRNEISAERKKVMDWQVVSMAPHSAFVEFGPKGNVHVPPELSAYASQFRGTRPGGDVKKLVFEWCKRKGIGKELWWPIFIKLMTKGMRPHPFFFKQMLLAQQEINKSLAQVVNKALSK